MSDLIDVKVTKVEKLTNEKFLNLYTIHYETGKGPVMWTVASRSEPKVKGGKLCADAVRIVPYFRDENGKIKVVMTSEFRYPVNREVWGTPAGLIDKGESPEQAARRELEEEIGASVVSIKQTQKPAYSSEGMTDEAISFFEAEIKLDKEQKLESTERITYRVVNLEDIPKLLGEHPFGAQAAGPLSSFYYEQKLLEKKQEINKLQEKIASLEKELAKKEISQMSL